MTHGSVGNFPVWEDLLVKQYGYEWRKPREETAKNDWKSKSDKFVHYWCNQWGLPVSFTKSVIENSNDNQPPAKRRELVLPKKRRNAPKIFFALTSQKDQFSELLQVFV